MNYYLARDGQTYGPYPQETFPSMLQQGQVVPNDLVCPEGGSEWVELSAVPGLSGAAPATVAGVAAPVVASSSATAGGGPSMPTMAGSSRLRISGGGAAKPQTHAPAEVTTPAPAQTNYPKAAYPQQKTGLMEKAAGAWGVLRIVGYVAVPIIIVAAVVIGYLKSQSDKREIARLHPLPGWEAFNAGNIQIDAEDKTAGFGNTSETQRFAEGLATAVELLQKTQFPPPPPTRYRGRSKIGQVVSAVNSATAGIGKPQVFVEKHRTLIICLVHVPDFSRYGSGTRREVSEACWETTHRLLANIMKQAEQLKAQTPPAAAPTSRLTRLPPGRPAPGQPLSGRAPQPPAASAAAASPPATPRPPPEFTLIVGVRGEDDYECVYAGKVSAKGDEPTPVPVRENVPSHKELVKWFDPEQWKGDSEKAKSE